MDALSDLSTTLPWCKLLPPIKRSGTGSPPSRMTRILAATWWTIFQDPQLDALERSGQCIESELKGGRGAVSASASRSCATIGLTTTRPSRSIRRPLGREYPPTDHPRIRSLMASPTNDFVLPFDFSYQVDVWGRVRRTVESYREQAQASAADLATVNLSMHADLAIDYFLGSQPRRRGTTPEFDRNAV